VTAVRALREQDWLAATDEVVVLNTGTGLIYPDTVAVDVPILTRDDGVPPTGR
jgi:threonine synthase